MDPTTMLVGMAICCLSAVLIYIITFLSVREKTYDEVIAEQRKRQEQEREKFRSDRKMEKELMKRKFKKGKGDKSKEKAVQISDLEQKTYQEPHQKEQKKSKMVSLEIEPEIIEPTDSLILGNQKSKNHSGTRKRSILHNKGEVTPIVEKAVELPHKSIKPLDDLELKKIHDKKTHDVSPDKKGKEKHEDQRQEVKEVKVQKIKAENLQLGTSMEEKAAKPKSVTVNGKTSKGSELVGTLRTAELNDLEIQSLIDVLLNRQGAGADSQGSWNKRNQKGDPTALMKKQLEDKDKALQEVQQRVMSSMNQVKELRSSLSTEREKVSTIEKQYQTQLSQHTADNEALKQRLSTIHSTHVNETAKVRLHLEQLESEKAADAAMCNKLKQENKILQESLSKAVADNASKGDVSGLKQKVAIMEKELSNNAIQLNAYQNAKKSSEDKLKKSEEQIKHLETAKKSEESLKKQVADLKEEKMKADTENTQLDSDLKKATRALITVEAECSKWKSKLQELELHLSSIEEVTAKLQESERKNEALEGNVKKVEKQLAEAVKAQKESDIELQQLRQENSPPCQQPKMVQEKQQTQANSAKDANGDVAENENKDVIPTEVHERIVAEKMALQAQLQTALDAQTQKNNEEVKQAVQEVERMNREVLKRMFPAVNLSGDMNHKDWLSSFEKQATQLLQQSSSSEKKMREKMNHLEEENSRLQADVEVFKNNIAILHSEKDRIHELEEENQKLQHQSETYEKNFMQLNADHEKLQHLEEENQRLKSASLSETSLKEEISRLQEDKEELQCRLREKDDSITEAEKKLHDLQRVVETEEKKLKKQLQEAEEALAKATTASEASTREQELEDLTIQQQTQIEHYRSVLTNTEQLLRQLESAEKTWEEKLQASQDELQKSKSDCQKFQEELHALRGSTEMQFKMDDLQEELQQANEQVATLTKNKEELTSKVIVLESQKAACVQMGNEKFKEEVEELSRQLEGERKRNKELSSTLVRLNGIIKTGQDALAQEQKVVQQLQDQLAHRNTGSGASANQEIEKGTSTGSDQGTSV